MRFNCLRDAGISVDIITRSVCNTLSLLVFAVIPAADYSVFKIAQITDLKIYIKGQRDLSAITSIFK